MRPIRIFISYRRDDSAGYARAVYDELARRFGAESVFMDVDDIGAGQAFADVIRQAVGDARLLLVLIGRRWLGEREGQPARIAEAGDLVRLEVATALANGMRVVPLLLDGAAMPTAAQLPDELRALTDRNALELDNSRYASDIERLVAAVRDAIGADAAPPLPAAARARTRWVAGALLAVAALVLFWTQGPSTRVAPAASSTARAAINGDWQAAVEYDWPNARYTERFVLGGEGRELHGTASFLGVPRGVLDGTVDGDTLRFVTRTQQTGAGDLVHRFRAKQVGEELHFVMQTEGGDADHAPVQFVARRTAGKP